MTSWVVCEFIETATTSSSGPARNEPCWRCCSLNANQVVSTDRLLDELWADGASKNPQNVLWVNISKLRSALDPDRPKGSDSTVAGHQLPGLHARHRTGRDRRGSLRVAHR